MAAAPRPRPAAIVGQDDDIVNAGTRRELLVIVSIAVCSLAYSLCYFNYDINPSDEGYLCYGTHRVIEGQIPGADFHAYEPGRYWVLAPFFVAFGEDVVVERTVLLVLRVLICVLAYGAARRFLPIPLAIVATAPTILVPGPWHKSWFSLLMLAAFVLAQHHLERPRRLWPLLGGLIVGTGCVFRLDIGLYAALLWGVAMTVAARSDDGRPSLAGQAVRFAIGVSGPIAAACVVLGFQGGLIRAATFYVSEYLNAATGLERIHPKIAGFPSFVDSVTDAPNDLFHLVIWLSMASALLLAAVIAIRWRRGASAPAALLLLWIAWACAFVGVSLQPDRSHLLQNGPLLWVVMASSIYLVEEEVRRAAHRVGRSRPWASAVLITVILAALIAENLFAGGINSYYTGSIRMRFGPHEPSDLPHASVEIDPSQAEEYRGLLEYIEAHSSPRDGLATCFCLPMINFISERENPTNLDILFPHTIGRPAQQEQFLEGLAGVKFFVVNTCEFTRSRPRRCPPNDHTLEDFAPAVVAHIENEWRPVFTSKFGFATIYARRTPEW